MNFLIRGRIFFMLIYQDGLPGKKRTDIRQCVWGA
jgi:hypothetical protein